MNPLLWYEDKFCSKCKEKTCQRKGDGIYIVDSKAKAMCIQAALLMAEMNREELRKIRK